MSATEERGEADGAGFARGDRARRGAARAASRERGAFRDGSFPCVCCGRRRDGCASRRRDRRRERARAGSGRVARDAAGGASVSSRRATRVATRGRPTRTGPGRARSRDDRAGDVVSGNARPAQILFDTPRRRAARRRLPSRRDAVRRRAARRGGPRAGRSSDPDRAARVRRVVRGGRARDRNGETLRDGDVTARAIKRKHANRSRREARKTRREASREGCGPGGARGGGRGHGHGGGRHLGTEVGAVGGVRRPCGGRVQRWPRGAATVGFYRDLRSPESRAARRSRRGVSTG